MLQSVLSYNPLFSDSCVMHSEARLEDSVKVREADEEKKKMMEEERKKRDEGRREERREANEGIEELKNEDQKTKTGNENSKGAEDQKSWKCQPLTGTTWTGTKSNCHLDRPKAGFTCRAVC